MVARGRFELPSMGIFLVSGVQSPSLAGSLFSTLASPLHHRATRDPGPWPNPSKPSAQKTSVGADETASSLLSTLSDTPQNKSSLANQLDLGRQDRTRG